MTTSVPIRDRTRRDPLFDVDPARLVGVLWRRPFAYCVDVVVISAIVGVAFVLLSPLWVLSFGLLTGPIWLALSIIPLAYHTLLIGGPKSATFGQRLFGIEVLQLSGARPSYFQAFLQTVLFYVTVAMTWGLVLIVIVLNRRRRGVHDYLAGALTLRHLTGPDIIPPGARP